MATFINQTKTISEVWFGVTSANLETADRGDTTLKLSTILDGTGLTQSLWVEVSNPSFPQEFTLDLGANYIITKVRSRSSYIINITDFDVYASETNGNWETAIAEAINPTDNGTSYTETVTTEKVGRYVRVVLNASTLGTIIAWGFNIGFGNCFDVGVVSNFTNQTKN